METYQKWETKGRRREIRKGEIRKKQMVLKELERFVKEEDQQQEDNPKMQQLIKDCHNLPFFKFDQFQYRIITREQHHSTQFLKYSDYNYRLGGQKYCCFNHIIGLPTKNGIPKPLYDYQQFILKSLFEPAYNNSTVPSHAMADSHQEKYEREKERQRGTSNILSPEKVKHVAVLKASGLGISELILRVAYCISLLLQEVEDVLIRCVRIFDENSMFQHYQRICHIYCTDIVCSVYFWWMKQQLPALLLIIRGQHM